MMIPKNRVISGIYNGIILYSIARIVLMDADAELTPEEHAKLWREWGQNGPQGPISEEDAEEPLDDEPSFPPLIP
jgi:hypothetical protein